MDAPGAGLGASFSPLFGAATRVAGTLRLLAKAGALRNSRTAPFLVCALYADTLCQW